MYNKGNRGYEAYQNRINRGYEAYQNRINKEMEYHLFVSLKEYLMYWIDIPDDYLDYLRRFENRIPCTNYGNDAYKPFFGVLFEKENMTYVTQVSHPKSRHYNLKQSLDFYKLYDKNDNRLLAVVNLNYMFPIKNSLLVPLEMSNIKRHRNFKTLKDESKYIYIY